MINWLHRLIFDRPWIRQGQRWVVKLPGKSGVQHANVVKVDGKWVTLITYPILSGKSKPVKKRYRAIEVDWMGAQHYRQATYNIWICLQRSD